MTEITASAIDLARSLRRFRGKRARFHRSIEDEGVAWVIVYETAVVRLTAVPAGVRIQSKPVSPGGTPTVDEIAATDDLDEVFARIDAQTRATLPRGFVERFDDWVAEGGGSTSANVPSRAPGPTITATELDEQIRALWGADAAVAAASAGGELTRRVRVRGAIDVVIALRLRRENRSATETPSPTTSFSGATIATASALKTVASEWDPPTSRPVRVDRDGIRPHRGDRCGAFAMPSRE